MRDYLRIPARPDAHRATRHQRRTTFRARARTPRASRSRSAIFARIAPEKGLHNLVEAYRILRQERGLPPSRLRAAGYMAADQQTYLEGVTRSLESWGLGGGIRVSRHGRSRDEGALPARRSTCCRCRAAITSRRGCICWKRWPRACRPCTESRRVPGGGPRHRRLGARGLGEPAAIADALARTVARPQRAADSGVRGRPSVEQRLHRQRMAERVEAVYREAAKREHRPLIS